MSDLVKRKIYAATASFMLGMLAFMIAYNAGVPVWRHGLVVPGDASDIGVTTVLACWFAFAALRAKEQQR